MTVRDEIKALIDEFPESRLRIAKALLLQSEDKGGFRKEFLKKRRTHLGRTGWSTPKGLVVQPKISLPACTTPRGGDIGRHGAIPLRDA